MLLICLSDEGIPSKQRQRSRRRCRRKSSFPLFLHVFLCVLPSLPDCSCPSGCCPSHKLTHLISGRLWPGSCRRGVCLSPSCRHCRSPHCGQPTEMVPLSLCLFPSLRSNPQRLWFPPWKSRPADGEGSDTPSNVQSYPECFKIPFSECIFFSMENTNICPSTSRRKEKPFFTHCSASCLPLGLQGYTSRCCWFLCFSGGTVSENKPNCH